MIRSFFVDISGEQATLGQLWGSTGLSHSPRPLLEDAMDSHNVPEDIAPGAGSFWLWFKKEFDEKALTSRGEAYPSAGASWLCAALTTMSPFTGLVANSPGNLLHISDGEHRIWKNGQGEIAKG